MNLRRISRFQRRGVVLLDVILGALLLATGLTIVVSLSTQSLARQVEGEHRMTAAWLADEILSMILVEGPHELAGSSPEIWMGEGGGNGRFDEPFSEYTYELDINYIDDYQPYLVTVHIRWPSRSGIGELSISTKISQRRGEDEEEPPREPLEPLDRDSRYFDEDEA